MPRSVSLGSLDICILNIAHPFRESQCSVTADEEFEQYRLNIYRNIFDTKIVLKLPTNILIISDTDPFVTEIHFLLYVYSAFD